MFKITRTEKKTKIYRPGLWGRECREPSAAMIESVEFLLQGSKQFPSLQVFQFFLRHLRDQQVLALVVSRRGSPADGACMHLWTHFLPPRNYLCFLFNQAAGSLFCLPFNYLFSFPLEDRVRSDPLLLKHQIEGRAVLSVKVYNNLSIHRMQNNKM